MKYIIYPKKHFVNTLTDIFGCFLFVTVYFLSVTVCFILLKVVSGYLYLEVLKKKFENNKNIAIVVKTDTQS